MNTEINTIFCLVSRQPLANVLPVLMFKPKNVILFATPEEKNAPIILKNSSGQKKLLQSERTV